MTHFWHLELSFKCQVRFKTEEDSQNDAGFSTISPTESSVMLIETISC